MSKPSSRKTAKKRKRRKKYIKEKHLIKTTIIRTEKKRKASLFDLAREGGIKGKRAMKLLMDFKLSKEENDDLMDMWIKISRETK